MIRGIREMKRQFLHVDYMVTTGVHMLQLKPAIYGAHCQQMLSHTNIATGFDHTIRELADSIARIAKSKW